MRVQRVLETCLYAENLAETAAFSFGADYLPMLDLLPIGVCLVERDTWEIVLANSSAARTLESAGVHALIGSSLLEFVQPHRHQEVQDYLRHVATVAPAEFFHERIELPSGRLIDLEIAAGILDVAGRSVIQVAFHDVTDRERAAALGESEALFRRLAETTDAAIFLFRGIHNIHVNAAACTITGYSYHELVAMPFWQILHPDHRNLVRDRGLARQHGEEVPSNYEVAIVTKDGETRWLQYAGNLIDYQGQPAVLGTAIDITARKEIEQALRSYARRLETLSQIDRLGLLAISQQEVAGAALDLIRSLIPCHQASILVTQATQHSHVVLAVSPQTDQGLRAGQRFKAASSKSVPEDPDQGVYAIDDLASLAQWTPFQKKLRRMGLRSYISVPLAAQSKLLGLLTLASREPGSFDTDTQTAALEVARRVAMVLHNAQLFGELDGSHRRLEELSRRLVQVQETERRAIARELHDEVGQTLTALGIHLELASRAGSEEQLDRRIEAQRLVEDLAQRVRRISLDLRPPMLDDLGLLPTLLWYFEWAAEQLLVQVTFEHHGIERRFDADIETAVFRIIQEALTNVARHAQTATATVRMWADSAKVSVQIEDKGQGFDLTTALNRTNSTGLRGMQERARLLGGKLVIEASPGSGACLTALFPLRDALPPAQGDARP